MAASVWLWSGPTQNVSDKSFFFKSRNDLTFFFSCVGFEGNGGVKKGLIITKNEIVLYLAHWMLHCSCAKYRTISFFLISRPPLLHHHCLQILYTTNFLVANVFLIYLFHSCLLAFTYRYIHTHTWRCTSNPNTSCITQSNSNVPLGFIGRYLSMIFLSLSFSGLIFALFWRQLFQYFFSLLEVLRSLFSSTWRDTRHFDKYNFTNNSNKSEL